MRRLLAFPAVALSGVLALVGCAGGARPGAHPPGAHPAGAHAAAAHPKPGKPAASAVAHPKPRKLITGSGVTR